MFVLYFYGKEPSMPDIKSYSDEQIVSKILLIRHQKVMLDSDLAKLYGVATKSLNQAVKRNSKRFPADFMFQLSPEEFETLRSQIVTSKSRGGRKTLPYAFTEQGVAMLSSVLSSERAIAVNIHIIRIFSRMRQFLLTQKDILLKIEQLEKKVYSHDDDIKLIFEYLKELLTPKNPPTQRIGFRQKDNET